MEIVRTLLEEQPMVALFLTIAIGYLVGEINIKGFSLGVGAVLFVALVIGWFAPKSVPASMIGTLGLALFLYAVGIQYGKDFFAGCEAPRVAGQSLSADRRACAGARLHRLLAVRRTVKLGYASDCSRVPGRARRRFRLRSPRSANDDPAVGYGIAYPFGVAGPILMLYGLLLLKPQDCDRRGAGGELRNRQSQAPRSFGKSLDDVMLDPCRAMCRSSRSA